MKFILLVPLCCIMWSQFGRHFWNFHMKYKTVMHQEKDICQDSGLQKSTSKIQFYWILLYIFTYAMPWQHICWNLQMDEDCKSNFWFDQLQWICYEYWYVNWQSFYLLMYIFWMPIINVDKKTVNSYFLFYPFQLLMTVCVIEYLQSHYPRLLETVGIDRCLLSHHS